MLEVFFCRKILLKIKSAKTTTIYITYKEPTTTKTYKHYTEYKYIRKCYTDKRHCTTNKTAVEGRVHLIYDCCPR